MRSGSEQAASWGGRAGYQAAAGAAVLTLRPGDEVWLEVNEGDVYEPGSSRRGYTTFSGFRVG